jgi:hypothetical protein
LLPFAKSFWVLGVGVAIAGEQALGLTARLELDEAIALIELNVELLKLGVELLRLELDGELLEPALRLAAELLELEDVLDAKLTALEEILVFKLLELDKALVEVDDWLTLEALETL